MNDFLFRGAGIHREMSLSECASREAVEELGISEETARTVLERVFSKVGVARQSELAALTTKQDCEAHCPWSYQASNFR